MSIVAENDSSLPESACMMPCNVLLRKQIFRCCFMLAHLLQAIAICYGCWTWMMQLAVTWGENQENE